jgi:hypothetical protein
MASEPGSGSVAEEDDVEGREAGPEVLVGDGAAEGGVGLPGTLLDVEA